MWILVYSTSLCYIFSKKTFNQKIRKSVIILPAINVIAFPKVVSKLILKSKVLIWSYQLLLLHLEAGLLSLRNIKLLKNTLSPHTFRWFGSVYTIYCSCFIIIWQSVTWLPSLTFLNLLISWIRWFTEQSDCTHDSKDPQYAGQVNLGDHAGWRSPNLSLGNS